MIKRFLISGVLLLLLPGMMLAFVSCGSEKNESGALSKEVAEMVRYYQEMRKIGLVGEVEPFLAMRDSLTKAEIDVYFERKGWVIDSTKVSDWSFNWPDIAGLPLHQDTIDGLWRRMIFRQCGLFDEASREQCVYSVIMWRKNGDEWKVANATRVAAYRFNEDGSPLVLHKFLFHKMFRLPPSFIDLHEKVGPSNIEPRPLYPVETQPKKK